MRILFCHFRRYWNSPGAPVDSVFLCGAAERWFWLFCFSVRDFNSNIEFDQNLLHILLITESMYVDSLHATFPFHALVLFFTPRKESKDQPGVSWSMMTRSKHQQQTGILISVFIHRFTRSSRSSVPWVVLLQFSHFLLILFWRLYCLYTLDSWYFILYTFSHFSRNPVIVAIYFENVSFPS